MGLRSWFRGRVDIGRGRKSFADPSMGTTEAGWAVLTGGYGGGRGTAPPMTSQGLLEGYSSMPWLRAAAGRVSEAVSTTPWLLYRPLRHPSPLPSPPQPHPPSGVQPGREWSAVKDLPTRQRHKEVKEMLGTKQIKQVASGHPLLALLTGGSELMPGQQVMKITSIHVDLVGEAFWLLERDQTRTPRAVYPLVPTWVKRLPTRSVPFYTVQMGENAAEQKQIPVTEIIRFTDPNPLNPFGRGSGLARTLSDELQTDEFASKLMKMRFVNSGRPDIIVSADDLNQDEVQRLEEGWLEKVSGFMKSFKPFFAARKLDVKIISQSFQELQMIELRKFERDSVIQGWGMPPEILGILTNSNRATIQSADFIFSAWVVEPRLEFYRRTLQFSLVPLFDERLMLDFESPIDEDRDFRLVVMKVAPKAFKVDEFRELAGLEPLPDGTGQQLYVPSPIGGQDSTPPQGGGLPSSVASLELEQSDSIPSLPAFRRRLTSG